MDDFSFFLKLAKPLVLNLADAKDRAMAALWLKKLCQANSHPEITDNIHVEYLKLLLFSMQSNRLTGIFEKPPSENLQQLVEPGQRKARDMISLVKTYKTWSSDDKSSLNGHPRVITSIGGDMCEYVAVQEIRNFGIHGYYAVSTEPLPKWTSPQSYEANPKSSSSECYKNTCDSLLATKERDSESSRSADTNAEPKFPIELRKKIENRTRHGARSLQKIFQAQRSEVAGVETRPCWGTSRYIDRLIDESPHLVADLDLSEADALLHLYRDRKLRKVKKSANVTNKACAISSRRREAEMRLDMPPCASIADPFDDSIGHQESEIEESQTCLPENFDSHGTSTLMGQDTFDRGFSAYLIENENSIPIESAGSISLRDDYDMSTCHCTDGYESELRRTTDYGNWRNYAYESDETEQLLPMMDDERQRRSSNRTITNDSNAFREMSRLVADPKRREPPSRGKTKAPRIKSHSAVKESNGETENWNPQGHSTTIHQ